MLMPHGAQKLFGWFGGYGVEATGQFFAAKLGLPASLALVAGLIEFFGGLRLAVGFLTRPVAALGRRPDVRSRSSRSTFPSVISGPTAASNIR